MRNVSAFALMLLLFAVWAPASHADNSEKNSPTHIVAPSDFLSVTTPTFSAKRAIRSAFPVSDNVPSNAESYPSPRAFQDDAQPVSKKKYLPVLMSLVLPGAGEFYMGYRKRGIALVAAEATAWTGYAYYNDKGLDSRAKFEQFADAHWGHDRWIVDHPAVEHLPVSQRTFEAVDSIGQTVWTGWPGYHSYVGKDEEKENYYENIGKYDWFISGWEDWDSLTKPMNTALRDEYRAMRKTSNDELDTSKRFVYLSLAARAFSLVETIILVRRNDSGDQAQSGERREEKRFSVSTRATGFASGQVAFEYRFR